MKRLASMLLATSIFVAVPGSAAGQEQAAPQEHAADAVVLSSLAASSSSEREADEARVEGLLQRPEVVEAAGAAGLDIERLRTASQALADDDLRRVASQAAEAEAMLARADSVVISTTAIIIGLLVLILILVA